MNVIDLVKELNYQPKRKSATYGGEYSSPCPFCKDGEDRFLVWPHRYNKNGEFQGGRFFCRVCGKYGDAITFLREFYGVNYPDACTQLRIQPKERSSVRINKPAPKLPIAEDPPPIWKEKVNAFVQWSHTQLMSHAEGYSLLKARGFVDETISCFRLGFNPQTFFRERENWGVAHELKEDGKPRKLWLPAGLVIPTFSMDGVIKTKVRRSEWNKDDKWPKYIEISGSKQSPSIYGNTSLPCAVILESELDAVLIQQEIGDLIFCIALGGSTKPLDIETDRLLRKTKTILFLPDFDKAGKVAWDKWKKMFPNIQRILTPHEKSAGDFFTAGGDLRRWLLNEIEFLSKE